MEIEADFLLYDGLRVKFRFYSITFLQKMKSNRDQTRIVKVD